MNMFVHVFLGMKAGPYAILKFCQEDGHFHLPHLPNSSKNHHEISWDHTITSWWSQTFFLFLGKWSNLTTIFQVGWFNRQPDKHQYAIWAIKILVPPELTPKHTREPCTKVGIKMTFHWTMGELQDSLCIWWKDSSDSGVLLCQNDPTCPFLDTPV